MMDGLSKRLIIAGIIIGVLVLLSACGVEVDVSTTTTTGTPGR